ncbi:hypothetical protein PAPHI01_0806 [Pancytospora philotis]|nr:hypothetical protein PAPHI01_0806 [Pancytospora philotis]
MRQALFSSFILGPGYIPPNFGYRDGPMRQKPANGACLRQRAAYSNPAFNTENDEDAAEQIWWHEFLSALYYQHASAAAQLKRISSSLSQTTFLPLARFFEQSAAEDLQDERNALLISVDAPQQPVLRQPRIDDSYDLAFFESLFSPNCSELTSACLNFRRKYAAYLKQPRESFQLFTPPTGKFSVGAHTRACRFIRSSLLLDASAEQPDYAQLLGQMRESDCVACLILCNKAEYYAGSWADNYKERLARDLRKAPHLAKGLYEDAYQKVMNINESMSDMFSRKIAEFEAAMAAIKYLNHSIGKLVQEY